MTVQLKHLKYEVLVQALQGQTECGDQYIVKELPNYTILAVVDGLGHGEKAAFAAKLAIQTIDENPTQSIKSLFSLCNELLLETRGAAMTIVHIDTNLQVTYMAVGNVMGLCWLLDKYGNLKKRSIFLDNGIVGLTPSLAKREDVISATPGDTIILATDGISSEFVNEQPILESPSHIAQNIFSKYRNLKDDGLLLVAQLL